MSHVRAISLGAGVQSTVVLLMALEGELQADCAIFADTEAEPAAVYEHLWMLAERCEAVGFPLYIVTGNPTARRSTYIPAFTEIDGGAGISRRQCTREWKLDPIRRQTRALVGPRGTATAIMGISLDEVQRMRTNQVSWITNEYPLVDRRMTRWDCQRYLAERGITAPRSACVFCPYHSNGEWRGLTPDEFEAAATFEERLQAEAQANGLKGTPYLHRSLTPLRMVDLSTPEDHGQERLAFSAECEGMCGV